ncbi:hypothetical protein J6590_053165 [Homalodisca vitripennis]|nr:hypothetical protein J6590_053165 [Homalodisca vitripennis]
MEEKQRQGVKSEWSESILRDWEGIIITVKNLNDKFCVITYTDRPASRTREPVASEVAVAVKPQECGRVSPIRRPMVMSRSGSVNILSGQASLLGSSSTSKPAEVTVQRLLSREILRSTSRHTVECNVFSERFYRCLDRSAAFIEHVPLPLRVVPLQLPIVQFLLVCLAVDDEMASASSAERDASGCSSRYRHASSLLLLLLTPTLCPVQSPLCSLTCISRYSHGKRPLASIFPSISIERSHTLFLNPIRLESEYRRWKRAVWDRRLMSRSGVP